MIYVLFMDAPGQPSTWGLPTRVQLVGPFSSTTEAAAWAEDPANNPHDVPTWQCVDLETPAFIPVTP